MALSAYFIYAKYRIYARSRADILAYESRV